ncbi:hypothetical protein PTKIN_Ptkin05aG0154800 [Pterospermum kingtungense]
MAKKMQLKFDKYWGNCNLLISIAAVLDPKNKMTLIEFALRVIYSENKAPKQISVVHDSLYELYKLYVDEATAGKSTENNLEASDVINKGSTASMVEKGKVVETERSKFERYVRSVDTVLHAKSELDTYLEERIYICQENSGDFDALEW